MNTEKFYSSLNILLDSVEGSNLLLEYYADFSSRIFKARDFKSIVSIFYEELRKIYVKQKIEFVLWHNNQRPIKFVYNPDDLRVSPTGEFTESHTIYNYVLEEQQIVLTNNYRQFCENLGVGDCDLGASSWLGVPMTVRGKVLGMVVIWDDNPERYLRLQDKQFLSAVANMASFSMENIYLYNYIVEKNGSYKIFETVLPDEEHRNSVKSVIRHLLTAVLQRHETHYSAIFLRSQFHERWRLLTEKYEKDDLSTLGLDIMQELLNLNEKTFEGSEFHFWHSHFTSHPLDRVFRSSFNKYPLNSVLMFPFSIQRSYYGVWIVAFDRTDDQPGSEEYQFYRFVSYLLIQMIDKKAILERKNKYEDYLKHLEKMKLAGELASSSAHHLNNILSVILGKSQMLQKKFTDTQLKRDLRMIEQAASDGAKSVRRLQSVSSSSGTEDEFVPLNINELIQEVVEIARPRFEREAQSRGITYDLKLSLGKIYPVMGDSTGLREVLLNLINNGLDSMPRGGKLSIQSTIKEDDVLIFISDTGIGIPEKIREKIFEPFFTTKGEKGNGLGLSIAADIISRHKGKIYVDSIPGKGSIMLIELPAVKDESFYSTQAPASLPPVGYKVLLVDDEGVVRETLAEMLEDEGCEVTMARNAEDAILKFKKYQCEVVLTDLSMPGLNGYELAQRIKQMDHRVPVLLITGWNQLDRKFMQSNKVIDGVIEKPFNMTKIRQQINRIMNKNGRVRKPTSFRF